MTVKSESMNLSTLDILEGELINTFRNHPFFSRSVSLSSTEFFEALLQRRFLSTAFTPVFDAAIDGMMSSKAIKVSRELVREEYPEGQPSHRELLVKDLEALGISRLEILSSKPSTKTEETIQSTFSLLGCITPDLYCHEVRVLSLVRSWGEVLVAEEYDILRPALTRFGINADNSQFYWPHFEHDQRKVSFSEGRSQGSHSDWLTTVLRDLLNNSEKVGLAAQTMRKVFKVKYDFWSQF